MRAIRRWLEQLDAASLPVFSAHLIVVLLAFVAVGDKHGATPLWLDMALVTATFFVATRRLGGFVHRMLGGFDRRTAGRQCT